MDHTEWLEDIISVTRSAGALIMQIYQSDFSVRGKDDESPVTDADEQAEALILEALHRLTPDIPVIAEEAMAAHALNRHESGSHNSGAVDTFWLVDPLDGTREFVSRNGEFTVNIALIHKGEPVLGVVYAPAIDRLFAGCIPVLPGTGVSTNEPVPLDSNSLALQEAGGVRSSIRVRSVPKQGATVLASRSHGDTDKLKQFLADIRVAEIKAAGSSLKICLIAAGEADLYPRFGRTMEWDTAAGHAVLRAAGGYLTMLDGSELRYGKAGYENPDFVARGNGG